MFLTADPEERARRRAAELGLDPAAGAGRADHPRRARPHPRAFAARAGARCHGARHHAHDISRGGPADRPARAWQPALKSARRARMIFAPVRRPVPAEQRLRCRRRLLRRRRYGSPDRVAVHLRATGRRGRPEAADASLGSAHEGRNRRISQRRKVLAGQPAHRVARGGGARAPRSDTRPQGAAHRLERPPADADRHGWRRPRRPGRDGRRCSSRCRPRWPTPTPRCWWSTRASGLRPGDHEIADLLRRVTDSSRGRRQQGRRRARHRRWPPSSTRSASASRSRCRRRRASAPATCSTGSSSWPRLRRPRTETGLKMTPCGWP